MKMVLRIHSGIGKMATSKIPNSKHQITTRPELVAGQINLKYQYPMTQTGDLELRSSYI
jgi:hypothetical protein